MPISFTRSSRWTHTIAGAGPVLSCRPQPRPDSGTASLAGVSDIPSDSFFAATYFWGSNVVISYRGTDDTSLLADPRTGWVVGAGNYAAAQAQDAAAVFQQWNGNSIAPNPSIVLTGHSLGGGLAGFVGEILR